MAGADHPLTNLSGAVDTGRTSRGGQSAEGVWDLCHCRHCRTSPDNRGVGFIEGDRYGNGPPYPGPGTEMP